MSFVTTLAARLNGVIESIAPWTLAICLIYATVNSKVLPFAWHTRVFYGYFRHYYFDKRPTPALTAESPTLFQPTIYTISTPLGEIDYSLHKSNSTYLTDLDVARGHHIYTLCRVGFREYSKQGKGILVPALGGVTCTFRKEIRPFAKVDIWTRVLSWDDKWIYLISHFVRAGQVRPARYSDQSWRKETTTPATRTWTEVNAVIYATCISKYVLKQNRKTVRPAEFLQACGLLAPPTTAEHVVSSTSTDVPRAPQSGDGDAVHLNVEERRQKGMALAQHVAALDDGNQWFLEEDNETAFAKY